MLTWDSRKETGFLSNFHGLWTIQTLAANSISLPSYAVEGLCSKVSYSPLLYF